ncbi:hypothetical protein FA10DRAFT_266199 [Acaromyces ingoldii]|uniref:Mediator complex subunit 1 n=1 Tax=Acaromyces ingoldii TaxID=215250 RepID=A0A316YSQ3_9BASI|nr:hypothetical protein FA10DRAFT_266199 [Acaromyces ingoldii]PWN92437.1 hypothetical protein FA10DRAFT_266199 [Acaromyces ingoldii]
MTVKNGHVGATQRENMTTKTTKTTLQAELLRLRRQFRNVHTGEGSGSGFKDEVPVGASLHPLHSHEEQIPSLEELQATIRSMRAVVDSFLDSLIVEQAAAGPRLASGNTPSNGAAASQYIDEAQPKEGSSSLEDKKGAGSSSSSNNKARFSSLLREQASHLSTIDSLTDFVVNGGHYGGPSGKGKAKEQSLCASGFLPQSLAVCALDPTWLFGRFKDETVVWPNTSQESSGRALQALVETVQELAKDSGLEAFAEDHRPAKSSPPSSNSLSSSSSESLGHLYTLTLAASIFVIDVDFGIQKVSDEHVWRPKLRVRISYATDSSNGAGPSHSQGGGAPRKRDEGLCAFVHHDVEALGRLLFGLERGDNIVGGDPTSKAIAHFQRLRKTIGTLCHLDNLSSRRHAANEDGANQVPDLFAAMDDLTKALGIDSEDSTSSLKGLIPLCHAGSPYSTLVYHTMPPILERSEIERQIESASLGQEGKNERSTYSVRFSVAPCQFPLNGSDGGKTKIAELGSVTQGTEAEETNKESSPGAPLRFLAQLDPPVIVPRQKARKIAERIGLVSDGGVNDQSPAEAALASALFSAGSTSAVTTQAPSAMFATTSPESSNLIQSAMLAYSGNGSTARPASLNGSQANGTANGNGNVGGFSFHLGPSSSSMDLLASSQQVPRMPLDTFRFERLISAGAGVSVSGSRRRRPRSGKLDFKFDIRTTAHAAEGEQGLQGLEINSIPFDSMEALRDIVEILKRQTQVNELLREHLDDQEGSNEQEPDGGVRVEVTYELQEEEHLKVAIPVRLRTLVGEQEKEQVWICTCRLDADLDDGWRVSEGRITKVGGKRRRRRGKQGLDPEEQDEEQGEHLIEGEMQREWARHLGEGNSEKGDRRLEGLATRMYNYVEARYGVQEEKKQTKNAQVDEDMASVSAEDLERREVHEEATKRRRSEQLDSVIEEEDEDEDEDVSPTAAAAALPPTGRLTRRSSHLVSGTTMEKETHARRPSTASGLRSSSPAANSVAGTKRRASQSLDQDSGAVGTRRTSRRKS